MGSDDRITNRRLQNLDTLEQNEWGPPTHDSSLVRTCHQLRKKPIGEFSTEDLRIMIGQDIGSMFLAPLALEKLALEPLAEGNFFPGDLLCSLLRLPQDFWQRHWDLRLKLESVVAEISDCPPIVNDAVQDYRRRMT